MNSVLEGGEQLERELTPEPIAAPAAGSVGLHLALPCIAGYAWMMGLFHRNIWGNPGAGGAMEVSLVSSALPLPAAGSEPKRAGHGNAQQGAGNAEPEGTAARGSDGDSDPGQAAKPKPKNTPKTQQHQPQPSRTWPNTASSRGRDAPPDAGGATGPTGWG